MRAGLLIGGAALIAAGWAGAQSAGHLPAVLIGEPALTAAARLTVTTPSFAPGGTIPKDNTQYGANLFPGLTWSAGPAATRSYVVVVQGITAAGGV